MYLFENYSLNRKELENKYSSYSPIKKQNKTDKLFNAPYIYIYI